MLTSQEKDLYICALRLIEVLERNLETARSQPVIGILSAAKAQVHLIIREIELRHRDPVRFSFLLRQVEYLLADIATFVSLFNPATRPEN